jgi:hypothetical protein
MRELEMSREGLPCGTVVSVRQLELEKGIIPSVLDVRADSRELLVGRHERGSDIVREEQSLGDNVLELNNVVVSDNSASTGLRDLLGR